MLRSSDQTPVEKTTHSSGNGDFLRSVGLTAAWAGVAFGAYHALTKGNFSDKATLGLGTLAVVSALKAKARFTDVIDSALGARIDNRPDHQKSLVDIVLPFGEMAEAVSEICASNERVR